MENHHTYIKRALELARSGMESGDGGPFGVVIVKGDEVIAEGHNCVLSSNDPTAHAEVVAIRKACDFLGTYQLDGCVIYSSCEPCPMCLGAIYWARPKAVYYVCTREDAARGEFDDEFIYNEINMSIEDRSIPFIHISIEKADELFLRWLKKSDRKSY
ncbi:MAG: nucleoside deaminase [Saprospiraceae bacterium]|nr:nucleoside deaminase [Saprospiraceae bacterium]